MATKVFDIFFPDGRANNIFEGRATPDQIKHFFALLMHIDMRDHHQTLTDAVHRRIREYVRDDKPIPEELKSRCSYLFNTLAQKSSPDEIFAAFEAMLEQSSSLKGHVKEFSSESQAEQAIASLEEDFRGPYFPDALDALRHTVTSYESSDNIKSYYSKSIPFIQSSGMGKSRLADAFGRETPMINFVLRDEKSTGYPLPDSEIVSFVRQQPTDNQRSSVMSSPSSKVKQLQVTSSLPADSQQTAPPSSAASNRSKEFLERKLKVIWNHSTAMGLIYACFEHFDGWVESEPSANIGSLEELAVKRHRMMAPHTPDNNEGAAVGKRSGSRIKFCQDVVDRALQIRDELVDSKEWRSLFNSEDASEVRKNLANSDTKPVKDLQTLAKSLTENLSKFRHGDSSLPRVVVVFDEAATLLELDGEFGLSPGLYVAVNRIISFLRSYPIWFFFLSTESKIQYLFPADVAEPSGNYAVDRSMRWSSEGEKLLRIPPFLAFPIDIGLRRRMQFFASRTEEMMKPFSSFTEIGHMAMYGRPLWMAYQKTSAELVEPLAMRKLVGGVGEYDSSNADHVFAALSFRLSLDVILQNPRAAALNRSAVDSYMRVVISMDPVSGAMDTITPSEPILAVAAMKHLCKDPNWKRSVSTLCTELLEKGLVEKGTKGELFTRWILVLVTDAIRSKTLMSVPDIKINFTVHDFLRNMYSKEHHKLIDEIDPHVLRGKLNFSHFIPTEEALYLSVVPSLCRELLRRGAAMQLAPHQPTYDQLIPYYCGEDDEPFDKSKCGVILVQDKNKTVATTPESIFQESFTTVAPKGPKSASSKTYGKSLREGPYFVFNDFDKPILFLLFDLGVLQSDQSTAPAVQVLRSNKTSPTVWTVHSRGHGPETFGCVTSMGCKDAVEKFFLSATLTKSLHDVISSRNRQYRKLDPKFRYPELETEYPTEGQSASKTGTRRFRTFFQKNEKGERSDKKRRVA
ncbi:hypothetical protein FQN53_006110 [Emmonsiellopsis sp. PD_33]|nr:hypothetical protein FQN53_006110 [Emmonsiellopsis sp. PD_33]